MNARKTSAEITALGEHKKLRKLHSAISLKHPRIFTLTAPPPVGMLDFFHSFSSFPISVVSLVLIAGTEHRKIGCWVEIHLDILSRDSCWQKEDA